NTASNAPLTYTFNTVGTFTVKHTVTVPSATCPIDTLPRIINVAAKAFVDFTVSPNCQPANGLTTFTQAIPTGGPAITTYTWTFGDPGSGAANTGTGASATHNYNADGTYSVKLAITTSGGCNGDSTKNITINRKPQINGTVGVVGPLCDNSAAFDLTVPTIGNGVTGTAITRSFKGGIVNTSGINYNPALAGFGVDTIYYRFTTTNSCVDSIKVPITVNARPRGNFTITPSNTTCIPVGTNINFTSSINVPNSSVSSYSWFFESPDMSPSKRSNVANPSYNYPEGTHLALLTVTGANGCSFDTSQNITVSRAPSIAALVQADVCETATPFNLTAPIVTGVTGTGSFRSFKNAATSAGLYSPAIAGYGVDTIYYRFTTTNSCTDSVKLAINIKARPRGNFTFSPSGCLDASGLVNFTSNVNVPNSTIQTYAWEFRSPDMTAGNISSLQNPSHVYSIGTFTIKLGLTAANGCTFDTSQTVTFGRKAAPRALTIADVCENNAPFTLISNGSSNGVYGVG
ncbi:MAG: PKD domain-containing protein, partial [Dolichospermum sp.]